MVDEIEIHKLVHTNKTPIPKTTTLTLIQQARRLIVAKGKQTTTIDVARERPDDATLRALVIGPTGNLRAPAVRVGDTLVVGFTADGLRAALG